jgi:glycosyltransferase involved in cell wall biosynthesis
MKVAFLGNQARAMSNFWSVFLRRLTAQGHQVLCLTPDPAPDDDPSWEQSLAALGVGIVHYPLDRKGLNPVRDLATLRALGDFFRREQPDLLFAYTIKPVIYGALAAAWAGFPARERRNLMITGLGYMFEADSLLKRLLRQAARLLYRAAFSCSGRVFFQNRDDREVFERLSIIPSSIAIAQSKGTGVDIGYFVPAAPPEGDPVFLYVGRLIEAKGLRELALAAREIKQTHPGVRLQILGPVEHGLGAIPLDEVLTWQKEGLIEYLGETRDVRPFIAAATAVLLPSWREGTPVSLLEAMSMGRAVIAADAPGSREVVKNGENGFLTPVHDVAALAATVCALADDPALAARLGAAGRHLAENEFSADRVAEKLMKDMGI